MKKLKHIYFGLYFSFVGVFFLSVFLSNLFEGFALLDYQWFKKSVAEFEIAHQTGMNPEFPADDQRSGILNLDIIWHKNNINITLPSFFGRFGETICSKYPEYRHWNNMFIPLIPIFFWMLPIYRYFFSSKREYSRKTEKRILNLPVFLFAYTWIFYLYVFCVKWYFAQKYFTDFSNQHLIVLFFSFLISGALSGFFNISVAYRYSLERMGREFFKNHDIYGVKKGISFRMVHRIALMSASLSIVPLLMNSYVIFQYTRMYAGNSIAERQPANMILLYSVLIFVIFAGLQLSAVFSFRKAVQLPLNELMRRMAKIEHGDFDCKGSVLYTDEVGNLKAHFNRMIDGLMDREKIKDIFGKFVSAEIAEKIMKTGKVNLAGEEVQATILFSDIRDFTPLSEKMPPAELIEFLNSYFSFMVTAIQNNRGIVNKFIGDAVMAIFSPVFDVENHADCALQAAIDMRSALIEYNKAGKYPQVRIGIGLHSGVLIAGNVGTENRMEYTVIGDTVNVASRIESQTKYQEEDILISNIVLKDIHREKFSGYEFIPCGPIMLKGKSNPVQLYKVKEITPG